MSFFEILLLPFVFIYKGFISVLLLPYYLVMGFVKVFELIFGKTEETIKKEKKIIPELKKGEKIKVVKGVKSAYGNHLSDESKASSALSAEEKNVNTKKRQAEFEKLVKKAREEEKKRAKEQEKIRLERAKKEAENKKREQEARKINEEKESDETKDDYITFDKKIKKFFHKIIYNDKEMLGLEAKKTVLNEQFKDNKSDSSRMETSMIFDYIAKNPSGEIEKSSIEALSRVDVYSFLLAEGYEVYEITPSKAYKNILFNSSYKLNKSRLIFYLSQLSAYLKSGIALADSVKILVEQAKKLGEKKLWHAVYYDLSMGDVLSTALEKRKDSFPKLLVNMIKTAELTGNLTETLDDMVDYYTESESTRKQMKSAMLYPMVVSIFAVIVVTFILLWVVPEFVDIYADLGSEVPPITKIVIGISSFLGTFGPFLAIGLVILIFLYIYLFKNVQPFRKTMQQILMKLPVFGEIIIFNEVTIFTKTFANLINHNVFITDSMEVLSKITDNEVYKKLIYETARNLTKGEPISKAFRNHWAFPNIAFQMLITGEKTGRLGPMMERVSNYYQEQHRNKINGMKSIIEPILIVSLAVVVGGILLAVIIPMYGMYDAL